MLAKVCFSYLLIICSAFCFYISSFHKKNLAAARALMSVEELSAEEVASRAMDVAADMCVYTNKEFIKYTLKDISATQKSSHDD